MKLTKDLKFIQDSKVFCEVLEIYEEIVKQKKGFKKVTKIKIKKNDKIVEYDLECFQSSFNKGLIFGSFELIKS